jgi:Haloacid dehalogenase-like hydrolase
MRLPHRDSASPIVQGSADASATRLDPGLRRASRGRETSDQCAWREEFARAGVPISEARYAEYWHDWSLLRKTPMSRSTSRRSWPGGWPVTPNCARICTPPGSVKWVTDAHAMGLRLGVATNDDTHRAAGHLARLRLDGYLNAIVVLQPGLAREPAPDLYPRALKILNLDPVATLAVEDSSHGWRRYTGRDAGDRLPGTGSVVACRPVVCRPHRYLRRRHSSCGSAGRGAQ